MAFNTQNKFVGTYGSPSTLGFNACNTVPGCTSICIWSSTLSSYVFLRVLLSR